VNECVDLATLRIVRQDQVTCGGGLPEICF
jgi:hypothetical protein